MPIHHNNNLDDPLVLDVQSNFAKGQVSNARANLLSPEQGARLRNVMLDYAGVLESRRGFRDFGDTSLATATSGASGTQLQGLYYYDTLSTESLVAAASGSLWAFDGSDWALLSSATGSIATSGDVWFTQIADKLYFTDGSGNISEWDGIDVEDDVSTAATGLRYLCSQGFRLFAAANIDEIWCSLILPDAGSENLVDETGDTIVDDDPATDDERITTDYKTFFGSNSTFRVGTGDGDRITALVPWSDFNLLVFKEGSTYAVNTNPVVPTSSESTGTSVAEFLVRTVSTRIGCVANRSAVQVDNDCFFLARDGVRSIARTIQDGTQGISPALSYPVDDIIRRINWAAADKSCAAFFRGQYILAIPVDGSSVNNLLLVYNKNLNAWMYWDGLSPREFCISRYGGEPQKLVVLEENGNVLEFRDWFGFDQSAPADYSDLLTEGETIEAPANIGTAEDTAITSRSGYYFHYGVSFKKSSGETAMSEVVASTTQQALDGNPIAVTWDAPVEAGLTARIWGSLSQDGDTPDHESFILLAEQGAAIGGPGWGFDEVGAQQRGADMSSYVGDRPLTEDSVNEANEVRPVWQIKTRAFTFQDPISPKKPNHCEFEFDRSNALMDARIILDGDDTSGEVGTKLNTGSGFTYLPINLPFLLGDGQVVRKRYNLDNFNPAREIQLELTEAAGMSTTEQRQSEYLRLREINMSGYLETMEDQE